MTSSDVRECKAVKELKADVDGRGISSQRDARSGISSSMTAVSGDATSGDNKGKVKL